MAEPSQAAPSASPRPHPGRPARGVARDRPKVVYIMGAGRSGSTILGITLGNCAGLFYAGELDKWLRSDGRSPLRGEERARFWGAVRDEVDVPPELFGRAARCIEQSSAAFQPSTWAAQRRLRRQYRRAAQEVYRAVARTAGVSCIVDSSHFPRRARELQALNGIDLYILFLVRDPHSVVASWGREDVIEPQFGERKANAYLWLTYLLSLYAFLRQPRDRRLLVRHESFVSDPEGVLRDILQWLGSPAGVPDLSSLETGVPFWGNRVVKSDVVTLEARQALEPRRSRMTTLLQLPWRAVFSLLRPAARS